MTSFGTNGCTATWADQQLQATAIVSHARRDSVYGAPSADQRFEGLGCVVN